jgi:hypothetical protein
LESRSATDAEQTTLVLQGQLFPGSRDESRSRASTLRADSIRNAPVDQQRGPIACLSERCTSFLHLNPVHRLPCVGQSFACRLLCSRAPVWRTTLVRLCHHHRVKENAFLPFRPRPTHVNATTTRGCAVARVTRLNIGRTCPNKTDFALVRPDPTRLDSPCTSIGQKCNNFSNLHGQVGHLSFRLGSQGTCLYMNYGRASLAFDLLCRLRRIYRHPAHYGRCLERIARKRLSIV